MKTHYNYEGNARIFYDRHIRLWTMIKLDDEGNQIGNAEYTPCRIEAKMWLSLKGHLRD
jgi:hypothetical protein